MGKRIRERSEGRRSDKQRAILGALAVTLIAVLLVGGTFAYFSTDDDVSARFTLTGGTDVELLNSWNSPDGGGVNGFGLYSGESVRDTVQARNKGTDCYLRIRMRIARNETPNENVSTLTLDDLKARPTIQDIDLPGTSADESDPAYNAGINEMLDLIVGTLYFDSEVVADTDSTRVVSTETDLTPKLFEENDESDTSVKTVDAAFTRDYLKEHYGFLPNRKATYAAYAPGRSAARSNAAVYNVLGNDFRNVTSQEEYERGLFTFEYAGGTGGIVKSANLSSFLLTTVCVPQSNGGDYSTALVGGTYASTGEDLGYSITFWGEAVPAADYKNEGTTAEEHRQAAMRQLDQLFSVDDYAP